MKNSYYYGIFMAVAMVIFYLMKEEDSNRIMYLFAATWFVIHAVGEKIVSILKPKTEEKDGKEN